MTRWAWKNVKGGREAIEQSEREAREKAEREAQEKEERAEKEKEAKETTPERELLWPCDPAKPVLEGWANTLAEPGRITHTTDEGKPVYRVEIRSGDDPQGYGERAEMAMGNAPRAGFPTFTEGEEVWIALSYKPVSPYPISENHDNWNTVFQLHEAGGPGSPPLAGHLERNKCVLMHNPTAGGSNQEIGEWAAEEGRWTKLLLHAKFSASASTGFLEILGALNGASSFETVFAETNIPLLFSGYEPTHLRLGTYRGNWSPRPTAVLLYGKTAIATSRAVAEAAAF